MQRLKRHWPRCWIPSALFANRPHAETHPQPPVGASLLAKNAMTPRLTRMPALSLTFFASKLAPTG
ncbi:hypothetical protein DK871_03970 [Pseudomonas sp. L13]|nr:hypothetical protein [Pseudomonas sp. L13]